MSESILDPNTTPALQPPPGQVSNLKDPYNLKLYLILASTLGLGVSAIAVCLRIFTKVRVVQRMHLEEYILLFSECGFVAFTALIIEANRWGQGTHQWNVSIAHVERVIDVCFHFSVSPDHRSS